MTIFNISHLGLTHRDRLCENVILTTEPCGPIMNLNNMPKTLRMIECIRLGSLTFGIVTFHHTPQPTTHSMAALILASHPGSPFHLEAALTLVKVSPSVTQTQDMVLALIPIVMSLTNTPKALGLMECVHSLTFGIITGPLWDVEPPNHSLHRMDSRNLTK